MEWFLDTLCKSNSTEKEQSVFDFECLGSITEQWHISLKGKTDEFPLFKLHSIVMFRHLGLCGSVLRWLFSYQSECTFNFSISGNCSSALFLSVWNTQGLVLSPLLFSLHTLSLGNLIKHHVFPSKLSSPWNILVGWQHLSPPYRTCLQLWLLTWLHSLHSVCNQVLWLLGPYNIVLKKIQPSFLDSSAKSFPHAWVTSSLDYCNSCLAPSLVLRKLLPKSSSSLTTQIMWHFPHLSASSHCTSVSSTNTNGETECWDAGCVKGRWMHMRKNYVISEQKLVLKKNDLASCNWYEILIILCSKMLSNLFYWDSHPFLSYGLYTTISMNGLNII